MSNSKQRLTLNNLTEPQQIRELNRQLTWIWDQLLGGLSMKSLNDGARAVIDSKAGVEAVNELGEVVGQHSTQITQTETEIQTVAQSVTALNGTVASHATQIEQNAQEIALKANAETVNGLGQTVASHTTQITQNAQEIALKANAETVNGLGQTVASHTTQITQNAQEIALKANAGDPATGVDNEAGVVINANGVYVSGGEISLTTSDGEEYVNITGEGVSASGISAPNVAARYDGPDVIYVNPNATDAQVKTGEYVRSLRTAISKVNGKCLDKDVEIRISSGVTTYGDIELKGVHGGGGLTILGTNTDSCILNGRLNITNCYTMIRTDGVSIITASDNAVTVKGSPDTFFWNDVIKSVSGTGIVVTMGGGVLVNACVLSGATNAGAVQLGGRGVFVNTTGSGRLYCYLGIMLANGTVPSGGAEWISTFEPNNKSVLTADSTGGSSSAVSTATAEYAAAGTDSYAGGWSYFSDNDPRQGYVSGGGRIRGCIWFDNSTLRSALSGRTIRQATLRLHQLGDYGRGVAVGVQLYGTSKSYSTGLSGAPALTKSYGTIGTTEPGQDSELTIPAQAVSDLVSGTINGLMLYSEDTGAYKDRDYSKNYARFSTEDGQQPRLTVVYS